MVIVRVNAMHAEQSIYSRPTCVWLHAIPDVPSSALGRPESSYAQGLMKTHEQRLHIDTDLKCEASREQKN